VVAPQQARPALQQAQPALQQAQPALAQAQQQPAQPQQQPVQQRQAAVEAAIAVPVTGGAHPFLIVVKLAAAGVGKMVDATEAVYVRVAASRNQCE
jgi:hypothetical protein